MLLITSIFLFCLVIVLAIFVRFQGQRLSLLEQQLEQHAKRLVIVEQEMKALLGADITFGRSLANLKDQLNAIDDRQSRVENRRSNDGGYQHALKLLSMGSSVEEVMQTCNLTHAEAELLANLQAYKSSI